MIMLTTLSSSFSSIGFTHIFPLLTRSVSREKQRQMFRTKIQRGRRTTLSSRIRKDRIFPTAQSHLVRFNSFLSNLFLSFSLPKSLPTNTVGATMLIRVNRARLATGNERQNRERALVPRQIDACKHAIINELYRATDSSDNAAQVYNTWWSNEAIDIFSLFRRHPVEEGSYGSSKRFSTIFSK